MPDLYVQFWSFIILFSRFISVFSCPLDDTLLSLMTSFILQNGISSAVLATCWNGKDTVMMMKNLAKNNIMVTVQDPEVKTDTSQLLKSEYRHLAMVVDLECRGSIEFIKDANKYNYFKHLHHWLLLKETNYNNNSMQSNEKELNKMLEPLEFLIDSQVSLAHHTIEENQVLLQEVYKIGKKQSLIFTQLEEWILKQKLPLKRRRDDYNGISINSATVVIDDIWENFFDMRFKYKNSLGKCNFMLMLLISKMLNFTMNLTITDTWGFPRKGTNCYDGVVGLLQCGDVEIGALAILYKIPRLDRIDYAGETFVFGLSFKLLRPSLSEVSIIYTLPFSESVWVSYVLMVAVLSMALYATEKLERKINPSRTDPPLLFADAALNGVAIMCQEGSPRSPSNLSSRIVFLFLLLLSLFLTTSYSAIIVSLLQTPSNAINTLTDLIESPFKLSMKDISYNTKLVNDTRNPEIKRMFHKKLYTRPYHEAFTSEEIGVESLRSGLNAFYAGSEAYKVMSDTFEEHEKCRLKEISINPSNVLSFPVKKGSSYREHITQKARLLKETGMVDREVKIWFTQRPKCDASSQGFVSVRIKDFYPTLVVLTIGMLISILMLSLEFFYHKIKYGVYWPSNISASTISIKRNTH